MKPRMASASANTDARQSGLKWMGGGAERQCGRALRRPRSARRAAPPGAGDGAGAAPGAPDHGGPSAFDKLGEPTTKTDPKHLGIIAAASVVAVVIIIVLVNSRSDDAGVTAYGGGSGSHASYSSYSGQGPPSANTQGSAGETYFIRDSMRQLSQGMAHESVALTLDYAIQFDIVPGPQLVTAWSSIVHFTATGSNCCEYGDRVPGIW